MKNMNENAENLLNIYDRIWSGSAELPEKQLKICISRFSMLN